MPLVQCQFGAAGSVSSSDQDRGVGAGLEDGRDNAELQVGRIDRIEPGSEPDRVCS